MTKEEIQKNSEHWYNKYKDAEKRIADLKANFDYVLEGKDLEIRELKDRLAEEVELHLHAEEYIKSLEKEIEELKHNKKTVAHLADCLEEKMKERIADLEKENEQLKSVAEFQQSSNMGRHFEIQKLEKENAELKENRLQWHDLRKDLNDLPPKMLGNSNFSIEVLSDKGEIVCYNFHYCEWFYWRSGKPIAWCEIPAFDKE